MATKKVMRLVNPHTGLMECRACGAEHQAMCGKGRFLRGAWQCRFGCTWEDVVEAEKKRGLRDKKTGEWLRPGIGEKEEK